jgi:high-affinity Fe2+/Pb2+ permease
MGMRRIAIIALGTLLVWAPSLASACSVCFTGKTDETRQAFIGTTVFMTFLPLLLVGCVVWWLRRRAIAIREAHEARLLGVQPD